jgi:hypothetical protein
VRKLVAVHGGRHHAVSAFAEAYGNDSDTGSIKDFFPNRAENARESPSHQRIHLPYAARVRQHADPSLSVRRAGDDVHRATRADQSIGVPGAGQIGPSAGARGYGRSMGYDLVVGGGGWPVVSWAPD